MMKERDDSVPVIPSALVEVLKQSRHVVVLTGAGISAESGIPTFREAQTGLWARYDPQELATPQAFRDNPRLVWEWYQWRRELVSRAQPNPGHLALVDLEGLVPQLTLITQNVDGLHQRAGSRNVIELHGNIGRTKCAEHGHVVVKWEASNTVPPRCPDCGGLLRPDVVWFGESLPQSQLALAIRAAGACDIFFSVGTSAVIHPAASLPIEALQNRAELVEINPNSTPITPYVHHAVVGPSGRILPALVRALKGN